MSDASRLSIDPEPASGCLQQAYLLKRLLDDLESIAASGRQFTLVQAFDQTAFVLALDDQVRAALEGRGWCFE